MGEAIRLSFLFLLIGAFSRDASAQSAPASGGSLDEAVAKAVERGVTSIWSARRDDGSWPPHGNDGHGDFHMGTTALAAYALLESGVSPQDPRVAVTLDWLAKHDDGFTYSHALRSQVWLIVNRKTGNKYKKEAEADVKRLILSAWDGAYIYEAAGDGKRHTWDNSNSQMGVLGVWAGARANMEFIDARYWQSVLKHWLPLQHADGAWDYGGSYSTPSPSMTAAAIATLFICGDNLPNDAALRCQASQGPEQKALEKGLDWLGKNFEDSLREDYKYRGAFATQMTYYLYAVERAGMASGYKYFGSADWYKIGARWLVQNQGVGGDWGRPHDAPLAVLFLARGRNPILFNKLEYKGDWNNRPRALANLTEYIGRNFETPVNWQIVDLKSPVSDWHDAPILLLTGSKAPAFTDQELAKLRAYAQQGGTILSVAECGGTAFTSAMKKVYVKLFPDYELAAVSADHDLYSLQFRLQSKPRFQMMSNGVRPLAIHVEQDMVLPWQGRLEKTEAWAYEAAVNVFLYVTDKGSLRARGVSHWPEPPAAAPARKVKVARLRYAGNWDPEPLAFERLGMLMAAKEGLGVDASAVAVKDLPASGAAMASLTGTAAINLSAEEKESLRKYVQGGGLLLVDAAGGSKAFADSALAVLGEAFGAEAMKRLSPDSPLYSVREIKDVQYRRQAKARLGSARQPQLAGAMVGERLGVLFSREDVTCGLVGCASYACDGYAPQTAYEIVRNAVLLASGERPASTQPASAPAPAGN